MKQKRILSGFLAVAGCCLAVLTLCVVLLGLTASPRIWKYPEEAEKQVMHLMDAVCAGNYSEASGFLYGNPELGESPRDSSPAADRLWEAFSTTMTYELAGKCYLSDAGLTLDVRVRSLDVTGVLEGLETRTQVLLNERVQAASDSSVLYNDDNQFRQELLQQVLAEAVQQALEEDSRYQEKTVPLHLVRERGRWWIVPDAGIISILSGSGA